jgi:excinuclease ABC subunit C
MRDVESEAYATLREAARDAPAEPGVYIWRDEENRIIYVGKAKVLRSRLANYFGGDKSVKTTHLIRHSRSIETIIVSNEYEALLLENTLIKQHSPKYNINLKDGKTYPVIRVTAEDFPRVFRTRHIVEDGSLYFGPFPNVQAVDNMLELINKLFPLRKCRLLKKRENPCMYYHIDRCTATCCGRIAAAEYRVQVERVRKLLAGETEKLTAELTAKMTEAAAALKFEEAAGFRNAIRAISDLAETNTVADLDPEARDYIAWAAEGIFTTFSVFSMRGGRMTGRELFNSRTAAGEAETLETFITAYYSPDRPPPPVIYLSLPEEGGAVSAPPDEAAASSPAPPRLHPAAKKSPARPPQEAANILAAGFRPPPVLRYFTEQFGYAPEIISPAGEESRRHIAALAMARQNAAEELRRRLKERGAGPALDELARTLGLESRPERIEGFDIAQLDGRHPVASLISFRNGVPDRKNYRYFKLRTVVGLVDDFAAMREAVHRRYSRLIREGRELPDLVLVDGGIGQVNAARGVMDELGMDCAVAGLAKRDEEIWLPQAPEPIRLSRRSEALKVLQFVRDETHRFATTFNQKLRSGDLSFASLESVEGIGPRRAAAIMKAFGSLEQIAAAAPAEIQERGKIGAPAARAVRAAAKLALEDRAAAGKKLARAPSRRTRERAGSPAAALAEAALAEAAAESPPKYDGGE